MHDRAADPIGAATTATATATEIMILFSIKSAFITSETARRGKCSSSLPLLVMLWIVFVCISPAIF
jgi:hypothetical protein